MGAPPGIWTFLSSLGESGFFSSLLGLFLPRSAPELTAGGSILGGWAEKVLKRFARQAVLYQ